MKSSGRVALDRRLARIEGQIRGIRKMIDQGAYCCDVLQQVAAANSALNQVASIVAARHIEHCVIGHGTDAAHDITKDMTKQEVVDELHGVLSRLMR